MSSKLFQEDFMRNKCKHNCLSNKITFVAYLVAQDPMGVASHLSAFDISRLNSSLVRLVVGCFCFFFFLLMVLLLLVA